MQEIEKRKQAHIDLCLEPESQGRGSLFSNYVLPYRALPELDLQNVSIKTNLFNKTLSQPLIIGSMTGGSKHAKAINTNLAIAAEEKQVAMGVGSQRIALELQDAKKTFELVRKYAPTTVVFANMGAVQLNYGRVAEDYQRVVDMIKADGLYLHLNPLQEAIQPEGDTNFEGLLDQIAELVKKINVPVFVKEVGHGLDPVTAQALIDRGVAGVDCSGVGGTSWAWVEAKRREVPEFEEWFHSTGYPTDVLCEAYQSLGGDVIKVISGGVRTPEEIVKARTFGMDFYSMAQPFLRPALESERSVVDMISRYEQAIKILLFSCGYSSWEQAEDLKLVRL